MLQELCCQSHLPPINTLAAFPSSGNTVPFPTFSRTPLATRLSPLAPLYREASLRGPDDPFFKRFAAEASRAQITFDIFCGSEAYTDLASLAAIPRYTCGQIYHYPGFAAPRDGPRLHAEVVRNLLRPTAWEAVMRIRCSKGLRISRWAPEGVCVCTATGAVVAAHGTAFCRLLR